VLENAVLSCFVDGNTIVEVFKKSIKISFFFEAVKGSWIDLKDF
jgi:hypothetical protein